MKLLEHLAFVQLTPEAVQRLLDLNKSVSELLSNKPRLPEELNFKIRMRNNDKRLNDICFPFIVSVPYHRFVVISYKNLINLNFFLLFRLGRIYQCN